MHQNIFLLSLGGALICFLLGVWQWQRMEWKEGLLKEIKTRCQGEGLELNPNPKGLNLEEFAWQKIKFEGTPVQKSVKLWRNGVFETIQLVKTKSNHILIGTKKPIIGKHQFTAVLYPDQKRGFFDVADGPEKGIFFVRDISKIAESLKIQPSSLFPFVAYLELTCPKPHNRHLGYVLIWWSLMLLLPLAAFFGKRV